MSEGETKITNGKHIVKIKYIVYNKDYINNSAIYIYMFVWGHNVNIIGNFLHNMY